MIESHSQLPPIEIGERLRKAREAANLTQSQAAKELQVARTTLIAIEQGERRVRIRELQFLAKLYGQSVNAILRLEAVHVDVIPRFRKTIAAEDDTAHHATTLLAKLAKAEVELEGMLGVQLRQDLPRERAISEHNPTGQAEQDALQIRQELGLGIRPIQDMSTFLELELGIRIYVREIDNKIDGLFVYDDQLGACVLLNAKHRLSRRNQTAAHEFGHIVSSRRKAEISFRNDPSRALEERYASAFGRAFLTPTEAVKKKFYEITAGSNRLSRQAVIVLSHYFGVSRQAMVLRLEELSVVKSGAWDWFVMNGGITDKQAQEVLGEHYVDDRGDCDTLKPTALRLNILACEAWRQNLLSEGQLAQLLDMNRLELRTMLHAADEGGVGDGSAEFSL
jgi:Zn-dependent peptidase ImmA (M78 family)/DNA-binding XRE family transcriptional regulator